MPLQNIYFHLGSMHLDTPSLECLHVLHVPSNFRPMSVVPIIAKILEKLVVSQLSIYFEQSQLLNPYQGAYHNGRSTEQIISFSVDTIIQALDAQ